MIASLDLAPVDPRFEEPVTLDPQPGPDIAAVPHKRTDWTGKVLEILNRLGGRSRLGEIASITEAMQSGNAPIQDAGQLSQ